MCFSHPVPVPIDGHNIRPEMSEEYVVFNGIRVGKKNILAEKDTRTLHSTSFVEFCSCLKNCSILGQKCQLAELIKIDVGYYSVTAPFYL